jgi:hypothetical protein
LNLRSDSSTRIIVGEGGRKAWRFGNACWSLHGELCEVHSH